MYLYITFINTVQDMYIRTTGRNHKSLSSICVAGFGICVRALPEHKSEQGLGFRENHCWSEILQSLYSF